MKKIFCLVLLFTYAGVFSQSKNTKPKNILFITIDDMNDWAKPFEGNVQAITPNIEKIANNSTIFKNAYCNFPLCGPSRASLLTGKLPTTIKVYDNSGEFRKPPGNANLVTLPQYFKNNGYETISSGKVFHNGRGNKEEPKPASDPISWNYQRKGNLGTPYPSKADKNPLNINFKIVRSSFDFFPLDKDSKGNVVTTENTEDFKNADYIVDYLNQEHDKPFFAACGIYRPHLPFYAPKKYFDMYDLDSIQLPYVGEDMKGFRDIDDIELPKYHGKFHNEILRVNGWKHYVRAYLANLTFADDVLGHLLDGLEKSPYKDNTIIVIMGDHGWSLGEKEQWKKHKLWEEATKTPLIIYDPSKTDKGRVSTRIVSLVDIYPTLISLTGLPDKEDLDGQSISPLLTEPDKEWNNTAITSNGENNHALRDEKYRYIRNVYKGNVVEELYNHENDPNEFYNLAGKKEYLKVLKEYRKKLEEKLL
ncbi:sulfatase [Flavivirga amylovorans]|uniref:Sulfatase n=1 Tax=Flavivirga amylovorans TaxID=870486 RepID=A0ABT8WXI7_9FLAO|nr:sulfatase [Flavivirga amylovorans]MDO5986212.1 sulfatase [Flavivirga amylovorans]